jgi:hypothetical protein
MPLGETQTSLQPRPCLGARAQAEYRARRERRAAGYRATLLDPGLKTRIPRPPTACTRGRLWSALMRGETWVSRR